MLRPLRALVLLAGLLLAGQLVAAAPAVAQPPDQPDVTGQLVPEAKSALLAWNPKVAIVVVPVGGDFPKGTDPALAVVVSQALTDPAQGVTTAAPQIALSVTARVPDLGNLTQAAAGDLIVRSGLRGLPSPPTAPPDWIVVDQSPPAGTIDKWGDTVEIVLGPPTLVEVPDLRGQSADQARATAAAVKLQVSIEATESSTQQPLVVVRQDPVPGKRVPPGTTVSIGLGAPGVPAAGQPSPPNPPSAVQPYRGDPHRRLCTPATGPAPAARAAADPGRAAVALGTRACPPSGTRRRRRDARPGTGRDQAGHHHHHRPT